MKSAALRAQLETALSSRVPSPFAFRQREIETLSAGIPEIDFLTGGLPRGALTEICGPVCSGRTTLLLSILTTLTARTEMCALVDARDALDPHSACAAGVELERLLWVRCGSIEQALRATDLVLHGGGFSLVALDLGDISPQIVRRVPLHSWFRLQRVIENTPTALVLLEQEPYAKTCASLVLQFESQAARWSGTAELKFSATPGWHAFSAAAMADGIAAMRTAPSKGTRRDSLLIAKSNFFPDHRDDSGISLPHSYLLQGAHIKVEVLRSRIRQTEAAALASFARLAVDIGATAHANTFFDARTVRRGGELAGGK